MSNDRNNRQRPGQDDSEWEPIEFGADSQGHLGHLLERANRIQAGEDPPPPRRSSGFSRSEDLSDKYVAQTLRRQHELKGYGKLSSPSSQTSVPGDQSLPAEEEDSEELPRVKLAEPNTGWGPFKKTLATTMASAVLLFGGYQMANQLDKPTQPGQPAQAAEVAHTVEKTTFQQASTIFSEASSYATKARDIERLSPEARTGAQVANERLLLRALEKTDPEVQLAALLANVRWSQAQYADKFLWVTGQIEQMPDALDDRRTGQKLAPIYQQMAEDVRQMETDQEEFQAAALNVLSEQAAFYHQLAEQGEQTVESDDWGPDQLAELEEEIEKLKEQAPKRGPDFRSGYHLVLDQALQAVRQLQERFRSAPPQTVRS